MGTKVLDPETGLMVSPSKTRAYQRAKTAKWWTKFTPEQRKERSKRYTSRRSEYGRKRWKENKEKWNSDPLWKAKKCEYDKRSRSKPESKERKAKSDKAYRTKRGRDSFNEANRKHYREEIMKDQRKVMLRNARTRAKTKGLPFDLVLEDIVIPERCPVLGVEFRKEVVRNMRYCASLDRILPELGYIRGNVEVISFRANKLKNDATVEEIEAVLSYMKKHNG